MKEQQKKVSSVPFFHYRGVSKCLSAGISFLTDHVFRFLWLTLPVTLPLAGAVGALAFVQSDESYFLYSSAGLISSIALAVVVYVLFVALLAAVYQLLDVHSREEEWWRLKWRHVYSLEWLKRLGKTLVVKTIQLAVTALFCWLLIKVAGLSADDDDLKLSIEKVVGYVVIGAVFIAVMVPSSLCLPSVQFGEASLFPSIWHSYRMGWRKWNKVFGLNLLTGILSYVLTILLMAPALVVFFVRKEAITSLLLGDAVALPSSFALWAVLVCVVSFFLISLVQLASYTPQAYLYAALKADENKAN